MSDDGALESFIAVLMALLLLVMLMFASAFALVQQYQRGRTAADLAAVGAAGSPDPCNVAAAIVNRNDAKLVACMPRASEVLITIAMPTGLRGFGLPTSVRVTSRATAPDTPTINAPLTVSP